MQSHNQQLYSAEDFQDFIHINSYFKFYSRIQRSFCALTLLFWHSAL